MTTAIYMLSDEAGKFSDRYKIGSHTGDVNKLKSRYITGTPNVKIHYFIEAINAKEIEKQFKEEFYHIRINNSNDSKSEWVIMPLDEIFAFISSRVCKPLPVDKNIYDLLRTANSFGAKEVGGITTEGFLKMISSCVMYCPKTKQYITSENDNMLHAIDEANILVYLNSLEPSIKKQKIRYVRPEHQMMHINI